MNNGIGRVWAVNAEGGDEGRPNGVGPVIIENIDKLGGGLPDPSGASEGDVLTVGADGPEWAGVPTELPDSTGASQGDVLTVGSSGLEWAGVPAPTVDQNYSASSANAQSGVAVAQAISAIPAPPTYTAGDGIDITSGEISVKAGNGLSIGNATTPPTQLGTSTIRVKPPSSSDPTTKYSISDICTLTPDLLSKIAGEGLAVTLSLPFTFTETATLYAGIVSFLSESSGGVSIVNRLVLGQALAEPASVIPEGSTITFNGADAHTPFSNVTLQEIQADTTSIYHLVILDRYTDPVMHSTFYGIGMYSFGTTQPTTPVTTATYGGSTITDALNVDLPVPSTTGHSQGEVLSIGSSGLQWSAPAIGSVTSIQQVNALPATPDANTLYLIPEA